MDIYLQADSGRNDHAHVHLDPSLRDDARARGVFLRNRAIVMAVENGGSAADVARRYGVSRQWAYRLLRRFRSHGEAGLMPRSKAAHTIANRTDGQLEARIIAIRKELAGQGLDSGAESIASRLEREGVVPPANSTIHRILKDAGLVRPEPRKRPKASYARFEADLPNETWQSDFTHWPLADGTDALIVSWIDDHSRLLLYVHAFTSVGAGQIEASFRACCAIWGVPASTLTDNGTVYTTRLTGAAPGRLETTLALMGVMQKNGRPYHPQTQGKIERYHRTLKQWLAARTLAARLDELNRQLDEFQHVYNTQRPHRALGRRTPLEAYQAKGKALPDPQLARQARITSGRQAEPAPPDTPQHPEHNHQTTTSMPASIHRIDKRGCISKDGINGRRHTINAGRENTGRMVELVIARDHILVTDLENGAILVNQQLDPTRNYQPRHKPPTVNHAPTDL